MQPKKIALLAREAALDKKAEDPIVLDVSKFTNVAHYFLIAHGNSDRHVRAIAQNVADECKKNGASVYHVEGMDSGTWALIDLGAVLVHIFHHETREFYGLERLWGDAPRLRA